MTTRRFALAALASLTLLSCAHWPSRPQLQDDERLVFFHTAAHLSADEDRWVLPIHGWVYEPVESEVGAGAIETLLEAKYGLSPNPEQRPNFDRRVHLFLVDNERGKRITIELGDDRFELAMSAPNGHMGGLLEVPREKVDRLARDGRVTFSAALPGRDRRVFEGHIRLLEPTGISVISDFDDTVKITEVTDRKAMLERTFLRDFEGAPGMAALYQEWARQGAAFHFVSSSPWQLFEPLAEFLESAGFPWATLSLKQVRLKDRSIANLFKKGTETKPKQIEPILKAFPGRRFVLVGDSGEQDPEVYAALMRAHPDQILRIYIRNVTGAKVDDARFTKVFEGIDAERWRLFTDPSGLGLSAGADPP